METAEQNNHSLSSLLKELRDETRTLFRQEVALARTEMSEKASKAGRNAAYLVAGGTVALAGALLLLVALSLLVMVGLENAGLTEGTAAWLGFALVGLVVAGVGAALVVKARSAFKSGTLKPEKTIQSIKEDKEWTTARIRRA